MKNTIFKLWNCIKDKRNLIIISLIISVFIVLANVYIPILVANAIDFMIQEGNVNFQGIISILIKIALITCVIFALQWLVLVINNKISFALGNKLRNSAVKKLKSLPLKYIDTSKHGEIVSKIISDVDQICDGVQMFFAEFFTGILTILFTMIFMFSINKVMTFLVIVLTPLSIFIARFISKKSYSFFKKQLKSRGEENAYINEMVSNQKTIIAYNEQKNNIDKFNNITDELEKVSLKAVFFSSITNPTVRFINNLLYAIITFFGATYAVSGKLSVGGLICFLSYVVQYTKPFNEIAGVVTELQNAFACMERVYGIIDEPEEMQEETDVLQNIKGNVEFNNVSFGYTKEKELIHDLSLKFSNGLKIAIVGPTGAGKTTLINLLMRFYDVDKGKILIDNKDITKVTRDSLRKSFGMVLQDTWIKKGTILENIKLGKPDATYDDVIDASKKSMAYDFIQRLPNGFDTVVDDSSGVLSEGERQLISISRIMLMNPPMLILDEATSNIDTRTEERIQEAFNNLMKEKTTFIVAHRLSTIVSSDMILVVKDGDVVESGKHSELLSKNGVYAGIYNSQFMDE